MGKSLLIGVAVAMVAGLTFFTSGRDIEVFAAQNAAADQKIAASKIVKVVVYPNSALVTREVAVPAGNGLTELVVSPLPPQAISSSLYSEGTDGLRVLSTRFRTRQIFEDAREEVRKAEEERSKLEQAIEKLNSEIKAVHENMALLSKLENFASVTAVAATEKGSLNADSVIAMSRYVMDQRTERAKELVTLQQQLKKQSQQMEFVRRKLGELSSGSSKTERDAVIVIDRDNKAAGQVRLNYLVNLVVWAPQYKLRAGKLNENVQIDYLASLIQQSGEDWNAVDLMLSTAQPMLNASPPVLGKLEVSVVPRSSLPGGLAGAGSPGGGAPGAFGGGAFNSTQTADFYKNQALSLRADAMTLGNSGDWKEAERLLNEAAAADQTLDLMKSRDELVLPGTKRLAGKSNDGPSVTYHLPHKLSIPSRNDEQVVEVAKLSLAPKYYYKSVPVLNANVYRLADLVNQSERVLLPGEATMYLESDFVGRMAMPLVAIGEEFTAGFGVDPQLQIARLMMDKSRSTSGANQVLKYDYRILVNSYKTEKVQLQVWDRLPLSQEAETTMINLVKTTPELSTDKLYLREQRPKNLLRWDLQIEPAMNGEKALAINYEFRLELDKQMVFNVLQGPAANPDSSGDGLAKFGFGGGKGGKGGKGAAAPKAAGKGG
jgi:Domain of unknown function (DUF4139)/N-terminal domain of unknown function (DUF4140)